LQVLASRVARAARDRIVELRSRPLDAVDKGDGKSRDLKTVADDESERLIIGLLRKETEEFACFGEESHKQDERISPEVPTWVIDPVDGTTNLAGGIPLMAVSIGLWFMERPIVGAVCDVETGRLYEGTHTSVPTYDGLPIRASDATGIGKALIGFDWPHKDAARAAMSPVVGEFLRRGRNVRVLGSAVHALCLVAKGGLDAYANDELFDWDVAAALLFIEQAGGRITDRFGEPWRFGSRSVVASNGAVHDELLAMIQENHG
jgi:myo-inositol-1(or 4)-monophosphatase